MSDTLKARLQAAVAVRVSELAPQALATVWDAKPALVAMEELEVVGELAEDDNWRQVATLKGVATIWLTSQKLDELPIEALIASLVEKPIKLEADLDIAEGAISHAGYARLLSWRDEFIDTHLQTGLRLQLEVVLLQRLAQAEPVGEAVSSEDWRSK